MPTTVPKEPTIAALHDVWQRLDGLLAGLDDADWKRPTCLPGWNVQAVAAHLIGTESMLLGAGAPELTISEATHPHVRNDIGSFNEAWVEALASEPPADVLARFRADVAKRTRGARRDHRRGVGPRSGSRRPARTRTAASCASASSTSGCTSSTSATPSATTGGDGGPAAEVALDEIAAAMGYVVGKKAGAPQGSRVALQLTGAGRPHDQRRGRRAGGGRRRAVGPADADGDDARRGVRPPLRRPRRSGHAASDQVTLDGDEELGERLIANMGYTI